MEHTKFKEICWLRQNLNFGVGLASSYALHISKLNKIIYKQK